jgi:hypothetical protein
VVVIAACGGYARTTAMLKSKVSSTPAKLKYLGRARGADIPEVDDLFLRPAELT